MKPEKIGFIGLGLIGGSIAKTIHRIHPELTLIAYDLDQDSLALALEEGVIDEACEGLTESFAGCRYIFPGAEKYGFSGKIICVRRGKLHHHRCGQREIRHPSGNRPHLFRPLFYWRASDGRF